MSVQVLFQPDSETRRCTLALVYHPVTHEVSGCYFAAEWGEAEDWLRSEPLFRIEGLEADLVEIEEVFGTLCFSSKGTSLVFEDGEWRQQIILARAA